MVFDFIENPTCYKIKVTRFVQSDSKFIKGEENKYQS